MAQDKKELIQRFRKEGILEAAMKVIAEHGLDKATLEQVAEEAGISKATIYLYFKNKDDLYFHCVAARFDKIIGSMREAAAGMDDPLKKIEAMITTQLRELESQRDFFRVFLTEKVGLFMGQDTELGREFRMRHEAYMMLLSDTLREGMDSGLLRAMDPVKASYILLSMVRGMAVCKIMHEDRTPMSDEAGLILDLFFNGLKPNR